MIGLQILSSKWHCQNNWMQLLTENLFAVFMNICSKFGFKGTELQLWEITGERFCCHVFLFHKKQLVLLVWKWRNNILPEFRFLRNLNSWIIVEREMLRCSFQEKGKVPLLLSPQIQLDLLTFWVWYFHPSCLCKMGYMFFQSTVRSKWTLQREQIVCVKYRKGWC